MSALKNKGHFRLVSLTGRKAVVWSPLAKAIGVFSLIFLCLAYQACLAASGTLKFSISLDKSEYKPDEPINVSFKLENKGKTAVYVNKRFYLGSETMPKEQRDVFLIVTSPSGAKLPCKFSYATGFPKSDYFELLEPGKEVVEYPRNLRGYFDFNEPGVYKVVAVYQNIFGKEIGLDVFGEKLTSEPVYLKVIK
jgi:hypothetical protein